MRIDHENVRSLPVREKGVTASWVSIQRNGPDLLETIGASGIQFDCREILTNLSCLFHHASSFDHQSLQVLIAADMSAYFASFVFRSVETFFPRTLGDNIGSAPSTNRFPAHLSFLSLQDVVDGDVVPAVSTTGYLGTPSNSCRESGGPSCARSPRLLWSQVRRPVQIASDK
jgi:hypothetical protein